MTDNRSTSPVKTLDVTIVYLQMSRSPQPGQNVPPAPREDLVVMRAAAPSVAFYRFLYDNVGEPWLWYERRLLGDDQLGAIVQDPQVEVHVIYAAGTPAGYAELDRREPGQVELAYFGLLPEYIGRGLGAWFLRWAIDRAWQPGTERLWVHTCDLDHPRALETYLSAGFIEYDREKKTIPNPRALL